MLPDRVSNPGPLTYESGALPITLRGPAVDGRFAKKKSPVTCHEKQDLSVSRIGRLSASYPSRKNKHFANAAAANSNAYIRGTQCSIGVVGCCDGAE